MDDAAPNHDEDAQDRRSEQVWPHPGQVRCSCVLTVRGGDTLTRALPSLRSCAIRCDTDKNAAVYQVRRRGTRSAAHAAAPGA